MRHCTLALGPEYTVRAHSNVYLAGQIESGSRELHIHTRHARASRTPQTLARQCIKSSSLRAFRNTKHRNERCTCARERASRTSSSRVHVDDGRNATPTYSACPAGLADAHCAPRTTNVRILSVRWRFGSGRFDTGGSSLRRPRSSSVPHDRCGEGGGDGLPSCAPCRTF